MEDEALREPRTVRRCGRSPSGAPRSRPLAPLPAGLVPHGAPPRLPLRLPLLKSGPSGKEAPSPPRFGPPALRQRSGLCPALAACTPVPNVHSQQNEAQCRLFRMPDMPPRMLPTRESSLRDPVFRMTSA